LTSNTRIRHLDMTGRAIQVNRLLDLGLGYLQRHSDTQVRMNASI